MCGTYYVQALTLSWAVVLAAVPPGLLVTAILVVNNLRDIDTDRRAGKRTLAVMLGREGTRVEYLLLLVVSYVMPFVLWLVLGYHWLVLLPWLTLPLAIRLMQQIRNEVGRPLNKALAGTARLGLLFSIGLSIGLLF
ncbi:MAG: UbiA family prenyltransferase [Caldilineaceae bacterium]